MYGNRFSVYIYTHLNHNIVIKVMYFLLIYNKITGIEIMIWVNTQYHVPDEVYMILLIVNQ